MLWNSPLAGATIVIYIYISPYSNRGLFFFLKILYFCCNCVCSLWSCTYHPVFSESDMHPRLFWNVWPITRHYECILTPTVSVKNQHGVCYNPILDSRKDCSRKAFNLQSPNHPMTSGVIAYKQSERRLVYLRRPVEQVCCPRTLIPHQWRSPRCARIFLRRSISSRSLASTFCANTWLYFPLLKSFCRFKNQSGILNWRGFWIMATSFSISSAVSSPARLLTSISAFLQIRSVNRRPRPLTFVRPKTTFRFPSTLVFRIRRMCWNSAPCIKEVDLSSE